MIKTADIKDTLTRFSNAYDKTKATYEDKVRYNNSTYNSEIATRENQKAKDEFTALAVETKQEYTKFINEKFSIILSDIKEKTSAPATEDETLQLKHLRETNVTEKELWIFAEKYKGNYTASKVLYEIAQKNNINISFISTDVRLNLHEKLHKMCLDAISTYDNSSYITGPLSLRMAVILDGKFDKDFDMMLSEDYIIPEEIKADEEGKIIDNNSFNPFPKDTENAETENNE